MTHWTETLAQFSAAIRSGVNMPGLAATRYPLERGIEVYRNNYRGNLHDALAGAYPVIRQLAGDEFFRLLAKHYIAQHASRSGNLHHYGDGMASFLTDFEPARQLAYLPDMARLEWAYHRAYLADDSVPFELNRLAAIPPEHYGELVWRLHPSCSLLTTAYPVAAIWQAHQEGEPENFNIAMDSGGVCLLVFRHGLSTEIVSIAPSSLYWLEQLQRGVAMGEATEATLYAHQDFDLGTTLHHWLTQGVLIDFASTTGERS